MAASQSYSIKDLERLTGIKAHTIRIWEKRYGIPFPLRSQTNIRQYSDQDLRQLLNIAILRKKGLKISHIASLKDFEIQGLVMNGSLRNGDQEPIEQMILAMITLDEELFKNTLSRSIVELGLEGAFLRVIQPFFQRIGLMWQTGSIDPAQEHFVSNIIRQKLIVAINNQDAGSESGTKTFLIFLPEGEMHELGLLFQTYLIRKHGHRVIYLGQSTPRECVKNVFEAQHPDIILTSIVTPRSIEWVDEFLNTLLEMLPARLILVSGPQVWQSGITLPTATNLKRLTNTDDLKTILQLPELEWEGAA